MKSLDEQIKDFCWYQTIEFGNGVTSHGCQWCGDPLWPSIKMYTGPLQHKRILDLGCNAGIFCVRAALEGASECIGIDSDTWKLEDHYLDQALFVKSYFESKIGKQLPIKYLKGSMEEVVKQDLGHFDWCFAIASLYYSLDQDYLIKRLYETCDNVIARIRDDSRIEVLSKLFDKHGFKLVSSQKEDWSRLAIPTDEFYLYHYAR